MAEKKAEQIRRENNIRSHLVVGGGRVVGVAENRGESVELSQARAGNYSIYFEPRRICEA